MEIFEKNTVFVLTANHGKGLHTVREETKENSVSTKILALITLVK